jgi:hypothetical protein
MSFVVVVGVVRVVKGTEEFDGRQSGDKNWRHGVAVFVDAIVNACIWTFGC